ncbi:MAG: hypothetical protein IPN79_06165 [Saprospiraceae bacterium]|nr:hypothetical protein [Saprospiraceae bacterium]
MKANQMGKEIIFKVLPENSEIPDNQTETNEAYNAISDSIIQIVKTNENAVTIGIEGGWGTGKTTMIDALKKKLKEESQIDYFYYDSWAYEGDPLRRNFLFKILEQAKRKYNYKDDELNKIELSLQGFNYNVLFSIIIGISLLFVPLGTELLTNANFNELSLASNLFIIFYYLLILTSLFFDSKFLHLISLGIMTLVLCYFKPNELLTYKFDLFFSLALLLTTLPFIALLFREKAILLLLKILKNRSESLKAFSYFFGNKVNDIDSNEYENTFINILSVSDNVKKILVIDNLDRLEKDSVKSIWSNLQIFLQHRNPEGLSNQNLGLKNLWIILPYDKTALSQSWEEKENIVPKEKNDAAESDNSDSNILIYSINNKEPFIDKSIQLVINSPKLLPNNWINMARRFIKCSLINIEDFLVEKIIEVLKIHYSNKYYPSPRVLKRFVNQFGFYYSITSKHITPFSFETLAVYILERYIKNISEMELIDRLSKGDGFRLDYPMLDTNYKDGMAIFIFKLDKNKSSELLILEYYRNLIKLPYDRNVKNEDSKDSSIKTTPVLIKSLMTQSPESFWMILDKYYPAEDSIFNDLCVFYDSIWDEKKFFKYKEQLNSEVYKFGSKDVIDISYFSGQNLNRTNNNVQLCIEILKKVNKHETIITNIERIFKQLDDKNLNEIVWNNDLYNLEEVYRIINDYLNRNSNLNLIRFEFKSIHTLLYILYYYKNKDSIKFQIDDLNQTDYLTLIGQKSKFTCYENLYKFVLYCYVNSIVLSPSFVDEVITFVNRIFTMKNLTSREIDSLVTLIFILNSHYDNYEKFQTYFTSSSFSNLINKLENSIEYSIPVIAIIKFYIRSDGEPYKRIFKLNILDNKLWIDGIAKFLNDNNYDSKCKIPETFLQLIRYGDDLFLTVLNSKYFEIDFFRMYSPFQILDSIYKKDYGKLNEFNNNYFNRFKSEINRILDDEKSYDIVYKYPQSLLFLEQNKKITKKQLKSILENEKFVQFIYSKFKWNASEEDINILNRMKDMLEEFKKYEFRLLNRDS